MERAPRTTREPELTPWTVESSTGILKDRWSSVRADSRRTSEGAGITPFYVLEYADWVQVVTLDDQNNVVLVEQYRHGLGLVSLEIPTGGIEPEDVDPATAAQRELAEETGFVAQSWRHVATLAPNPANQNNRCHVVLALGARPNGAPATDPTERLRVWWVPVAEVVRLARSGAIIQAMHVAALALALTKIGRW